MSEISAPLILIIDDQRASRDALAQMLTDLGYRCATAESGLEGQRLVRDLAGIGGGNLLHWHSPR